MQTDDEGTARESASAALICVTSGHASAAFNSRTDRWNMQELILTSGENMPLLSASPSSSGTKLSSPPCVTTREESAAAATSTHTGINNNNKRCTQKRTPFGDPPSHTTVSSDKQQQQRNETSNDNDELSDLLSRTSTHASASSMVRVGGWRLRLRDIMFVIAFAGGMTTLALMYPRHSNPYADQEVQDAMTSNHRARFRHGIDDSDESDDIFFKARHNDEDTAAITRQAALNELAEELELVRAHDVRRSVNGELNTTLRVGLFHFTEGPISFWTRAYEHSIPGPLWSVQPGDKINVELMNELEPNVPGTWTPNTYHNPNSTNIHVHGMHMDPTGIADNVLRTAHPGESLVYQYPVPRNHPRGLYHYHPHVHGSIFLQLAGGMSGPILVEDDDNTLPDEYKHMKKHVLALQEFRFDGGLGSDMRQANKAARSTLCHRAEYTSKTLLHARVRELYPKIQIPSLRTDIPLSDELKMHLSKSKAAKDLLKSKASPDLSRFFTVNGQYLPKIEVQPHENVHLRLLNAGGSATVEFSLPGCAVHQIASDGIYLAGRPRAKDVVVLSPGARVDVVINCEPNDVLGGPSREPLRPLQSIKHATLDSFLGIGSDVYEGVLAFVRVSGASREQPIVTTIPPTPELYGAKADLRVLPQAEQATLESFPFEFSMDSKRVMKDGFPYKNYFVNHEEFAMKSIRDMPLNGVQEWVVVNARDEPKSPGGVGKPTAKNHPFHLHTNAFQIISMTHGDGVDYEVGDWRDVIAIPTPGNVTIRFRPVDFRGPVLAHCHIAGHSDAGMLALVSVV